MEAFAHECISQIANKEMENIATVFKSGGDDDVSEERLANTTFPAAIQQVKSHGSLVWSLLSDLALVRGHRDTSKKLSTVHNLFRGFLLISSNSRSFSFLFQCYHTHTAVDVDTFRNYSAYTSNSVV
jgi:hypothetical protein